MQSQPSGSHCWEGNTAPSSAALHANSDKKDGPATRKVEVLFSITCYLFKNQWRCLSNQRVPKWPPLHSHHLMVCASWRKHTHEICLLENNIRSASEQASGSNYHFSGNIKDRGICHTALWEYNPKKLAWKTLENPVYSTNKLQSEKEMERKLVD